jgi:hypothetical protein
LREKKHPSNRRTEFRRQQPFHPYLAADRRTRSGLAATTTVEDELMGGAVKLVKSETPLRLLIRCSGKRQENTNHGIMTSPATAVLAVVWWALLEAGEAFEDAGLGNSGR